MKEGKHSLTAEAAAFQRAVHILLDESPAVFADEEVTSLLQPAMRVFLRMPSRLTRRVLGVAGRLNPAVSYLRGQIVVRARYTEDQLDLARRERGITQYVILSAGLDTFALRNPLGPDMLRVYEVDQPDTQQWKRSRLGDRAPTNLEFIPVDFERQSIADALRQSSFDSKSPTFFSWLGTTYYLTRDSIFAALSSIAQVAGSGSELVLDYWTQEVAGSWQSQAVLTGVRFAVALQREPMLSFFEPDQLQQAVQELGWEVLENLSPEAARARYLHGRSDYLDVPDFGHLLHLRLP